MKRARGEKKQAGSLLARHLLARPLLMLDSEMGGGPKNQTRFLGITVTCKRFAIPWRQMTYRSSSIVNGRGLNPRRICGSARGSPRIAPRHSAGTELMNVI